jgi:hypothetical protein
MIKVGVLIPDRGDRPDFLYNCWRMVQRQTLKPHRIELVNDTPISDRVDITWRYRKGYERFSTPVKGVEPVDVIAFMENDDWYSGDYLETMVNGWDKHGRPEIFGCNYTIYYHLNLKAYFKMKHNERASAMNTLIRPSLKNIAWPVDHEPFTDSFLWTRIGLKGVTHDPGRHITIGMKHGVGKTGGQSHVDRLDRYAPPRGVLDTDSKFLKDLLDPESFEFYSKYFGQPVGTSFPNNTDFLPSQIDV